MEKKKTLVIGASENPARYSYLAVQRLTAHEHPVVAIGNKAGNIGTTEILTKKNDWEDINTITLYINPSIQKGYYDYILSLHPKRLIFNPGAENPELSRLAKENGIQPIDACTLVLLATNQY